MTKTSLPKNFSKLVIATGALLIIAFANTSANTSYAADKPATDAQQKAIQAKLQNIFTAAGHKVYLAATAAKCNTDSATNSFVSDFTTNSQNAGLSQTSANPNKVATLADLNKFVKLYGDAVNKAVASTLVKIKNKCALK